MAALQDPDTRENALLDLSKKRDMFADLAPILWHSFGGGWLYTLHAGDPIACKPPGFNPRTYQVRNRFQAFAFQMGSLPGFNP